MKRCLKRIAIWCGVALLLINVWFWLLPNGGKPRTLSGAAHQIASDLPLEAQEALAQAEGNELIGHWIGLGTDIRNRYYRLSSTRLDLAMLIATRDFRVLARGDYGGAYMIGEVWKKLRQDRNLLVE